jgi:hypothetical protein
MRRAAPAAALLLATLLVAQRARSQNPAADALFTEGLKLFDAGRTHEACERFEQSYRLDPALGTLQNLATCHEQDGRTARAHAEFNELAERANKAGLGQKAREILGRQRAAALEKKLSKIELHVGAGANVEEIRVDDAPLDRSLWQAPLALDPGPHTLVFRAAGKLEATQTVSVSVTPGVVPVEVPRLADPAKPPPPPRPGFPLRTVGLIVGGAGAVGLVLGGVFGGLTFAQKGAAAAHCTGMYCDAQGLSLQGSAHGFAAASTATFVIGLAAAGTGAFLFVWGGRGNRTAVRVGPAMGGATVSGVW